MITHAHRQAASQPDVEGSSQWFDLNDDREKNALTDREFSKQKKWLNDFQCREDGRFSHQISIDMPFSFTVLHTHTLSPRLRGPVIRSAQVCSFHVLVQHSIDREATYLLFEWSSIDYLWQWLTGETESCLAHYCEWKSPQTRRTCVTVCAEHAKMRMNRETLTIESSTRHSNDWTGRKWCLLGLFRLSVQRETKKKKRSLKRMIND